MSSGLSRGCGLSSGWPLKRDSTVLIVKCSICVNYIEMITHICQTQHIKTGIVVASSVKLHNNEKQVSLLSDVDSHTTGPGFKTLWVRYTFYRASD